MGLSYKKESSPEDWDPRAPLEPIWPEFVDGYLEAALWASTDGEGAPMDQIFDIEDFAQKAIDQIIKESNDFIKANLKDLQNHGNQTQHGHDFWLTRNHHGAGFWDQGYGAAGDRLTAAAHSYGEQYVHEGDDGKLYFG